MNRVLITLALSVATVVACTTGTAATPTIPTATSEARTPTATAVATAAATASPEATASPTPASTQASLPLPDADELELGRYYFEYDGYRFTFTIAEHGWSGSVDAGGVFRGEDEELAIFWPGGDIPTVFRRACERAGTNYDPGPSVDDLADALASLEDFETTAPTDVTVSGFSGRHVALTVPLDVDFSACEGGDFHRDPGRWYQANGQTDDIYVLDLDGDRQTVVVSYTSDTAAEIEAQLQEMLDSLEITPI